MATGVWGVAITVIAFLGCGAEPGDRDRDRDRDRDLGREAQALRRCDGVATCSSDQYCFRPIGACNARGRCDAKPEACIDLFDPACGCDGVTYSNACFAAMMGASVKSPGSCEADAIPSAE